MVPTSRFGNARSNCPDGISTKKDKEVSKDRVHVGDINLTEQTNSVTFHVRNNNGGDQFELGLIILERIKE